MHFIFLQVTPQNIKFQCIFIILKYTNPTPVFKLVQNTYNIAYKNESTINSKFNHLRKKSHIFFFNI